MPCASRWQAHLLECRFQVGEVELDFLLTLVLADEISLQHLELPMGSA